MGIEAVGLRRHRNIVYFVNTNGKADDGGEALDGTDRRSVDTSPTMPRSLSHLRASPEEKGVTCGAVRLAGVVLVVGGFLDEDDVVGVAFVGAGVGDADEAGPGLHGVDVTRADIAHGGAEAADQLVDEAGGGAAIGGLGFDAFGDELGGVFDFVLAVAVAGGEATVNHGADGAHAAVFLESFALPVNDFTGAGIGAR